MSAESLLEPERLDLADIVSTLLDKGVVVRGDVLLSVADIDLVTLDLGLMLAAVESVLRRRAAPSLLTTALGPPELTPERGAAIRAGGEPRLSDARVPDSGALPGKERVETSGRERAELREVAPALPERINVDPEQVENGLARLVLTLIEVLRKVLEHQAIRRMEGGALNEAEVERLGIALLRLHDRMQELKTVFGLTDEDLQIDLGPLGRIR